MRGWPGSSSRTGWRRNEGFRIRPGCHHRGLFRPVDDGSGRFLMRSATGAGPEGGMSVRGVSHVTFVVADLDRMEAILGAVLDARRLYDSGEDTFSLSRERFYDVAGLWVAVMEGERAAARSYDHVAFRIDEGDYDERLARIRALGLEIREGRPRVEGEGRSIYFHDHDGHLFELHTGTLEQRLARYRQGRKTGGA